MRAAIRNVGFNLAGQLVPMATALVAMPVLVRHAGTDRLGFLGLAWALIGYFALLDLGLSRVVTRRVAVADSGGTLAGEAQVIRRLCIQLFVLVAIVSVVLTIAVPAHVLVGKDADPLVVDEARVALWILWATLPFTVVTGLLRGGLEGLQQFGRASLLRAFFGAWSFGAPLAVLAWTSALGPLTAAIAIGRVLSLFAHAGWAFQALRAHEATQREQAGAMSPAPSSVAPPTLAVLFREGGWLTVSNVVGPMMVTFDRFAIASLVSLAAASYYFVPQEVLLRMLVLPSAIATTIFPILARTDREGAANGRITDGALRAIAATCLPLCAIVATFATPLLTIWMGARFAEASAQVAACLAAGLFANCCAQVPFAWIQAAGRSDITGKRFLLQLPIYAALLFMLTTRFGIVGAAIAWSIRALLDAALLYVASIRLFADLHLRRVMPSILLGMVLLMLTAAVPRVAEAMRRPTSIALFASCLLLAVVLARRLHINLRR